ncbi:MAG: G5 domain-containing protein [Oscillospiraceae bacterium]|nr:G5 domain-containing protein [Oscillospiraceae bacterium]
MKIKELASRKNLGVIAAAAAVLTVIGTAGTLNTAGGMTNETAEETDILAETTDTAVEETVSFSGTYAGKNSFNAAAEGNEPAEVEYVHRTRKKPVAFDTIYREDPTLDDGEEMVLVNGIEGEMTIDTLVTVLNGRESSVKTLSEVVTKAPVNKVVLVGVAGKGNAETAAPVSDGEGAETTKWKPLPLWQTKPDGTDVKIIKASERKAEPDNVQTAYIPQTETEVLTDVAVVSAAPSQISHLEVPSWVTFDENGIPTNYVGTHTGKACAYTANPGALMSTGRAVYQGYVAVDPRIIPYGSELYIVADDGDVYGYAIAGDTGYSVRAGDIIVDLFMNEYNDCIQWGNKRVTVYVLREGE